jgi:hypothetical protein
MTTARRLLLLAASLGWAATPAPLSSQESPACGVYQADLDSLLPDTSQVMVAYDSTSLATPNFALHAWVGLGLPKAGSDVPLTDSLWQVMRAAHRDRTALPPCLRAGGPVVRVRYDSLRAPFKDRENGWMRFAELFRGAPGLFILGEPLVFGDAQNEAFVYVGRAMHWLGGSGTIYYLRRTGGRWQIHGRHSVWAS